MVDFVGLEFLKAESFPLWLLWFHPRTFRVLLSRQGSECIQVREVEVAVLHSEETDALAVASEGELQRVDAHRIQILASKPCTESASESEHCVLEL